MVTTVSRRVSICNGSGVLLGPDDERCVVTSGVGLWPLRPHERDTPEGRALRGVITVTVQLRTTVTLTPSVLAGSLARAERGAVVSEKAANSNETNSRETLTSNIHF